MYVGAALSLMAVPMMSHYIAGMNDIVDELRYQAVLVFIIVVCCYCFVMANMVKYNVMKKKVAVLEAINACAIAFAERDQIVIPKVNIAVNAMCRADLMAYASSAFFKIGKKRRDIARCSARCSKLTSLMVKDSCIRRSLERKVSLIRSENNR